MVTFGLPISVWYLIYLYSNVCVLSSTLPVNIFFCVPVGCTHSVVQGSARVAQFRGVGKGQAGEENICVGARAKSFWISIYCANPRPNPGYQASSWSHRGLGRQALWIIWEYNLVTDIVIWPLSQPCTCEMGPSSFLPWVDTKQKNIISCIGKSYTLYLHHTSKKCYTGNIIHIISEKS